MSCLIAFHYRSYGTFFLQQNRLHNIYRGFTHYKYYRAGIFSLDTCSVTIKYYTIHEQDPEKVALFLKKFNNLKHLAPVYIDETGFDTYFYPEYGLSLKGQLIRGKVSGRRYQRIFFGCRVNK